MTEVLSNSLRTRTSRPTSEDKPLNGQTAVLTVLPRPVQLVRYATLKRQKSKKTNFKEPLLKHQKSILTGHIPVTAANLFHFFPEPIEGPLLSLTPSSVGHKDVINAGE